MQIKSLTLQNFRSYGEELTRMEFDRGILLFEGDIGSGKSSILYGIEFALFGLGEVEARHILRGSASVARVELEFQVGDAEYKVIRTIERKKGKTRTTIDSRGWISECGEKEYELSPTELKSKILQILNFREKLGKSSSRIYRFAIFTPQELMKEVLAQKPDERIETLRRAFGIEDYSFAGVNSDIIASHLENQARALSEFTKILPGKEEELKRTRSELEKSEHELEKEQSTLNELSDKILDLEYSLSLIESERDRARNLQTLIPEIEEGLEENRKQHSDCRAIIETYNVNMKEIQRAKLQASNLRSDYDKYQKSKQKLRELEGIQDKYTMIERNIADLTRKISSKEADLNARLSLKNEAQKKVEREIKILQTEVAQIQELDTRAKDLQSECASLSEFRDTLSSLNMEIGGEKARKQNALSKTEEFNRELKSLDGITSSKSDFCPLCKQKLTPDHLLNVRNEYDSKMKIARSDASASQQKLSTLESHVMDINLKISNLESAQRELEDVAKKMAKLQKSEELQEEKRSEAVQLGKEIAALAELLETRDFAREEEVEISSLKLKRDNLALPLRELDALKAFVKQLDLTNIEREYLNAESLASTEQKVRSLISKHEETLVELESLVSRKNLELKQKREELEQVEPSILRYEKLKLNLTDLEAKRQGSKSRFDHLQANVLNYNKIVEPLSEEVKGLLAKSKKAQMYKGYASWIETLFMPAIRDIETHVLDSINDEFNKMFHRWFSVLVEDPNISVHIDDRFTPLVEQSGYELDAQSLSGGERTAVALAYRLALNFMVKRANEALKANLLILDEPTEGFSKEQIYRLRSVLEELESEQVILVSHEIDLESLADRIYRVEKIDGNTKITMLG